MDLDALKACLRQWMNVSTWHTGHPMDEERFHEALHRAFQELGFAISGGDFHEVIDQLAQELHPDWSEDHRLKLVNEFAIMAEGIASYLYDTQHHRQGRPRAVC